MSDYGELALVRGMHYLAETQAAIAHNLANVDSTGFKRQISVAEPAGGAFSSILGEGLPLVRYAQTTDWTNGPLLGTGDKLHAAIEGDGFFVVADSAGRRFLTRKGAILVDRHGWLATQSGLHFLDAAGQRISAGDPATVDRQRLLIKRDGSIVSNDARIGQLAIVRAPQAGRLTQLGDALWLEGSGGDLEPARGAAVRQGSLERSNVDSLSELVQMITVQRGFQATARALTSLGRIKSAFVNATNR